MLRSRIAAAAVGAVVLGVTASLVPATSNAETVRPASNTVTWKDAAADFTAVPDGDVPLTDQWYWGEFNAATTGSITDHATLDADGLSVSSGERIGILRGVTSPIAPADLASVVTGASAEASGATSFALALQSTDDTTQLVAAVATGDGPAGLSGASTEWNVQGETVTTAELATAMQQSDLQVVGYVVYLGIDVTTPNPPTDEPTAPTDEPTAPATDTPAPTTAPDLQRKLDDTGRQSLLAVPDEGDAAVTPRAAPNASAAISGVRFDDTTTYFTPQPTAALRIAADSQSLTVAEATSTGVSVTGSGFAPGEVVYPGLGTSTVVTVLDGASFVADAAGNVSGILVLPPDSVVDPGTYTLTLLGTSSGQSAQAAITLIADPAAVAVPVTGRATFTG